MNQSSYPDVDSLALEYLRGVETGNPPNLDDLLLRLPDETTRSELRAILETAAWARGTFPTPLQPQAVIAERYVLLEELGSGGFGKVWRATDRKLGRTVALKLFHELIDPAQLESTLRRERQALARVDHEGVVRLLDCGRHAGTQFLAMEYVPGRTLDKVIKTLQGAGGRPALPDRAAVTAAIGEPAPGEQSLIEAEWQRTAARITVQVLRALAAAHSQQVMHRDLKPGNVLLRPGGRPVLLDFGLAGLVDHAQGTLTERLFGTAAYMAPEQLDRQRTGKGAATDIYQCGLLLYELLTFRRAFVDSERTNLIAAVREGNFTRPRSVLRDVPAGLEDICLRALERNPERRYASADAFRDDLERWLAGRLPAASRLGIVGRGVRGLRQFTVRHRVAAMAAALLVLGSASTAWFALRPDDFVKVLRADGSWSLTLGRAGQVCAWLQQPRGDGSIAIEPVQLAVAEGKPELTLELPAGETTVRLRPRAGAAVAQGRVVWFLATGDQADAWQILARDVYLAVEAQEEPLDSKAVQAIYVQAKQPGKAGGSIRVELPIDELLLR